MKQNAYVVLGFFALCGLAISYNATKHSPPDTSKPNDSLKSDASKPTDALKPASTSTSPASTKKPDEPTLELLFASSDGKKEWIDEVTKEWNDRHVKVGGKSIRVKVDHMRSGESREKILAGTDKPHLWSPVSRSWIDLMNETWRLRYQKNFIDEAIPTCRTALVIATWEPMARALGWPEKPIGWKDLVAVARDPQGWASRGHPEWGKFKFGHGHPDYSTSAMLSLVSLLYAEAGKKSDLTADDLRKPETIEALAAVERGIVHYGESSGWLTEKLCTRGPAYLSAVTLYESSVVKANKKFPKKAFPLVAIYPKEGTFWESHPAGIVNADWVTEEHRAAAKLYLEFLAAPEQQAKTAKSGFRPADPSAPVVSPIDKAHGVDPQVPEVALSNVSEEVFQRANALWHQVKKKSTVYLLLDTSGSMNGEPMNAAKRGAEAFLKRMEGEDEVVVIAFDSTVKPLGALGKVKDVGEPLVSRVRGLFANGNTALYDAIALAYSEIEKARKTRSEPRLYGIVVLTDGKDTTSSTNKLDLLSRLPAREDSESTKVFTIAYGNEADFDLLKEMSERSNAVAVKGDESNVGKIYLTLSSYF